MKYRTNPIYLVLVVVLLLIVGVIFYNSADKPLGIGSSEYSHLATTTAGTWLMKTGATTLGTVVIASSTAGTITIKNATSTMDAASTTVAFFPSAATVGTYSYDIRALRGLSVIFGTGYVGGAIITYR